MIVGGPRVTRSPARCAAALALVATSATAHADPIDSTPSEPTGTSGVAAPRLDFRAGLASSDDGRPTMCLEVRALWRASVEGCGTGSGFLYASAGREIAHFRVNVPFVRRAAFGGGLVLRGGAGFAELEVGPDAPGFQFGDPSAADRGAVAGPDGSLSAQWLRPLSGRFQLVGTATLGLAWFAGADRLVVPQGHFQPYASLELGVGW